MHASVTCGVGQYLDYKKCACKNKLVGKLTSECTSIINETMMNNKMSIVSDDTTKNIFIGLFSVLMFIGITSFCIFTYFKWIKGKNCLKINILIIKKYISNYKMVIKSLKIETKSSYNWDDMVYIFDVDVKLIKITKRKSKIDVDIYYIGYKFDSTYKTYSIKPFYLALNQLFRHIEKTKGSSDRYLVASMNNIKMVNIFNKIWKYIEQKITSDGIWISFEENPFFSDYNNEKIIIK